jgi:hypothetical protein
VQNLPDGVIIESWPEIRAVGAQSPDDLQTPLLDMQIVRVKTAELPRRLSPMIILPEAEMPAILRRCEETACTGGLSGIIKRIRGDKKAAQQILGELAPSYEY